MKKMLVAIGIAIWFAAVPAAASDLLVTASHGERAARDYPRGSRLPVDTRLRLRANESVTILTADGTLRFTGPGRFSLASARSLASNRFWLPFRQTERPRVAVLRMEIWPPPPDILRPFAYLWSLRSSGSRRFCYLSDDMIDSGFSGIDMPGVDYFTFTRLSDGEQARFRYDSEIRGLHNDHGWLRGWPLGLSIHSGDVFRIDAEPETDIGAFPVDIEFIQLDVDPFEGIDPSLERLPFVEQVIDRLVLVEEDLAAKGCEEQRDATQGRIARYREELAEAAEEAAAGE